MSLSDALFWIFAALTVAPAVGILVASNIVRMAFLLLASLAGFAGLYLHLGATFVGFSQVLVYIGGILVLFLFGVMLTVKADLPIRKPRGLLVALPAACAALGVLGVLVYAIAGGPWWTTAGPDRSGDGGTVELGYSLLGTYALPFEAVSVLLLVAMVGAAFLARGPDADEEAGRSEAGGPDGEGGLGT